jgi:hypothetical protein
MSEHEEKSDVEDFTTAMPTEQQPKPQERGVAPPADGESTGEAKVEWSSLSLLDPSSKPVSPEVAATNGMQDKKKISTEEGIYTKLDTKQVAPLHEKDDDDKEGCAAAQKDVELGVEDQHITKESEPLKRQPLLPNPMDDEDLDQADNVPPETAFDIEMDDDTFVWSSPSPNEFFSVDDGDMGEERITTMLTEEVVAEQQSRDAQLPGTERGSNEDSGCGDKAKISTSSKAAALNNALPSTPDIRTVHKPRILRPGIIRALTKPAIKVVQNMELVNPRSGDMWRDSSFPWQPTWDASPAGHSDSRQSIGEASTGTSSVNPANAMYHAELELCRRLDEEYEQALEDREVSWRARYTSIRQSALFSSILMILYLVLGCWFYTNHTTWNITDSLLFTLYSVTTVGYGNHMIPKTASFQLFTMGYILVGIALITVLAAHMYQFIVLEATKVQFERDTAELARRSAAANAAMEAEANEYNANMNMTVMPTSEQSGDESASDMMSTMSMELSMRARFMAQLHAQIIHDRPRAERIIDSLIVAFERTKTFLKETHTGQILSVFLPFCGLILFGAIVVGVIEGWTMIESTYWAVVTLTTVGFGDYHPTQKASTWFCIFYLPCSLFFMSFFLAQVAQSYIKLHAVHVQRLENRMRARIQRARDEMMAERSLSSPLRSTMEDNDVRIQFSPSASSSEKLPAAPFCAPQHPIGESDAPQSAPPPAPVDVTPKRGFLVKRGLRGVSPIKRKQQQNVALGFEFLPPDDDDNHRNGGQTGAPLTSQHHNLSQSDSSGNFSSSLDAPSSGKRHREKVLYNSTNHMMTGGMYSNKTKTSKGGNKSKGNNKHVHVFKTMKAVLKSMKSSPSKNGRRDRKNTSAVDTAANPDFDVNFNMAGEKIIASSAPSGAVKGDAATIHSLSHHSSGGLTSPSGTKPSFALRMLVQERMAQIIAIEVAGFQSEVVINENTLSVTIPSLKDTAEKWMLPRRARKAFRAVAFRALFYVGERNLIIQGADTLLNLSPFEFHGLLSPVLAAMGDGGTMEDWLASTDVMADVELTNSGSITSIDRLTEEEEHEII